MGKRSYTSLTHLSLESLCDEKINDLDEFVEELTNLQLTVDEIQVRLQNLQKANIALGKELKSYTCGDVGDILEEVPSDDVRFRKTDGKTG